MPTDLKMSSFLHWVKSFLSPPKNEVDAITTSTPLPSEVTHARPEIISPRLTPIEASASPDFRHLYTSPVHSDYIQHMDYEMPHRRSLPERQPAYHDVYHEPPPPFQLPQSRRPSPRSNRREKEPMRYNGKGDWSDFLGHFEAAADWNEWTEYEKGLQLAICLTDEAREVFSSLPAEQRYNFKALTDALTCRFSPEGRESQYSLQLINRTCQSGEDVTTFGHALRRLASKAYPGQQLDERILVDIYIKGLPNADIKRHVYLAKPTTLSEAISCAVTYEAFDSPLLRRPKPVAAVQEKQPANKPTDSTSQQLYEVVTQLSKTVENLQNKMHRPRRSPMYNRSMECYNCHQPGHIARNCPAAVQIPNRVKVLPSVAQNPMPSLNC